MAKKTKASTEPEATVKAEDTVDATQELEASVPEAEPDVEGTATTDPSPDTGDSLEVNDADPDDGNVDDEVVAEEAAEVEMEEPSESDDSSVSEDDVLVAEETASEEVDVSDAEEATSDEVDIPEAEEPSAPPPDPAPAPPPPADPPNVFMPMFIAGILCVAIGFGLARFVIPEGWPPGSGGNQSEEQQLQEAIQAQAERLTALEAAQAEVVEEVPVDDPRVGELAEGAAQLVETLGHLEARLATLDDRMTAIEALPRSDGSVDTSAYEAQISSLQAAVEAQRAEVAAIAEEAANQEAQAAAAAQATLARAAVSRIMSAIDTGEPFAAALAELSAAGGAAPSAELQELAESGVPTLSALQSQFPDAARAALAAARSGDASDGAGGLGTFFARQLGARSTTPREGSDPDAVLSRAEAAVGAGRVTDAIAEIETLPAVAQEALAPWVQEALSRQEARSAVEALNAGLAEN